MARGADPVTNMQAGTDLGMANVQVAVRFRRKSGHDFAASGFEVRLQLGSSIGNAHLTTSCLSAEGHHLVYLHTSWPTYLYPCSSVAPLLLLFSEDTGKAMYMCQEENHTSLVCKKTNSCEL